MPNGIKSYDKDWLIDDTLWRLRFLKRMADSAEGWCVYDKQEIQVKKQLCNAEKFDAFIHEISHAMDDVYDIGLTHSQIYKLEKAWANFLIDNLYGIIKVLV